MKITVLVENSSSKDLAHEHGLSLFIEHEGKKYLLDTGSSDLYLENAKKLGIDISSVDIAMLSHGHYDHSGGFGSFVEVNKTAPIYMREHAAEGIYAKELFLKKYIGIPKAVIRKAEDRFTYVSEDTQIAPGVFLIGHHTKGLEERGKMMHMYYKNGSKILPDDFGHEQSLVFDTNDGLVIFNSCSHGGVDNIIKEVQQIFHGKKVRAVIGGFHLMDVLGIKSMRDSKEEVEELGRHLLQFQVDDIYTCHCTGIPAFRILKEVIGEKLHGVHTGDVIELS